MHEYQSLVNTVTGALGGRRIYAWLWFHAVGWCMFLFALTGPIEHDRNEGKTKLFLGLVALSTATLAALLIRALVTGKLYDYFFEPTMIQKPAKDVYIFIRYATPALCLGSCISRWFFNWYFE